MGRKKKTTGTFDDWFSNYSQQNGIDISGAYGSGTSYSQNNTQPTQRKKATFDDWFTNYKTENNIDLTQKRQETPSYTQPSYRPTYLPTNKQAPKYTQNPLVQAAQNKVSANNRNATASSLQQLGAGINASRNAGMIPVLEGKKESLRDYAEAARHVNESYGQETIDLYKNAEKQFNDIDAQIQELKRQNAELNRQAKMQSYQDLIYNPDFAENSQYKSTANGKEIRFDNFGTGLSETGFDDYLYDYINKNEDAIRARGLNTSKEEVRMGADDVDLQNMTEEQVRIFNYLYQSDKDKAYEYIEDIRPELQAIQAQKEKDEWSAFAQENPVLSSAVSVLAKPMNTIDTLTGVAVDKVLGNEIDPNAGYFRWQRAQKAIRDTNATASGEWAANVAADLNTKGYQAQAAHQAYLEGKDLTTELDKIYNQENYDAIYNEIKNSKFYDRVEKLGSTTYGSVMSQLDNLYNTAVTGGLGGAALVLMSASAMPDTIVSAKERGLSDTQALSLGVISSLAEYFTEKVSLEALFDMEKIARDGLIPYLGAAAFTEGSEEVASDFINFVAEHLIAGDKSEFSQTIAEFEAQGMSHEEAVKAAWANQVEQTAYSFIGGAIAGGGSAVFVGGANQANAARLAKQYKSASPEYSPVQQIDDKTLVDYLANRQQTAEQDKISNANLTHAAEQLQSGKEIDPALSEWIMNSENAIDNLEIETGRENIRTEEEMREALSAYPANDSALRGGTENMFNDRGDLETRLRTDYISDKTHLAQLLAKQSTSNAISDETIQKTFGESGQAVFREISDRAIQNGLTPAQAYQDITLAYNAGSGRIGVLPSAVRLSSDDFQKIYKAGIEDAKAYAENDMRIADFASAKNGVGVVKNDLVVKLSQNDQALAKLQTMNTVAKALGVRVNYVEHLNANGMFNKNTKEITIAADADRKATFDWVFGHEITHRLQQVAPNEYTALKKAVAKVLGTKFNAAIQDEMNKAFRDGYKMSQLEAQDEVVANFVADLNKNRDVLNSFIQEQQQTPEGRSLLQKVRDFFREILNKLKGNGNALKTEIDSIQRVIDALEKTYAVGSENVAKHLEDKASRQEAFTTDEEFLFSTRENATIFNKAVTWNKSSKAVPVRVLTQAGTVMEAMKQILEDPDIAKLLPDEENALSGMKTSNPISGEKVRSTVYGNESYGYSVENSTICTRSLAMELLLDRCAEIMGHSLTTREAITLSQMAWSLTDEPTCQYCYVFADRLAQRQARDLYITQRDAVLKSVGKIGPRTKIVTDADLITPVEAKNGVSEDKFVLDQAIEANSKMAKQLRAYNEFLAGRKNTENQRERFLMFLETQKAGIPLVTREQVASEQAMLDAVNENPDLLKQMHDVYDYSNKASHAKAKVEYTAYNSDILKLSDSAIELMNKEYGVRFYSYSDYHPAFILENMQMFTDAAVRGLKGLAYTKDLDYVRIFADTGVNINVSCKAIDGTTEMDAMQGADWAEAQELRSKYKNVGVVMVCTSDEQVEWALAQDWVDCVLPYHTCFSAEVGKAFSWKDYRSFQSDKKLAGWNKGTDVASISPYQHANNKAKYLQLCKENHLEPRFSQWLDNPNYMKLVVETRQAYNKTKPLQPKFNLDAAKESIAKMKKRGGYNNPFGGSIEEMNDIAAEFVGKLNENFADLEGREPGWAATREFGQNTRLSRKDSEGFNIDGNTARWTDERISSLIREYGASNPDYSQAYAVLMNPRDYLKLTLSDEMLERWNKGSNMPEHPEMYSLDEERLRENTQTPFLKIYSNDGTEIQGHEGRHRMRALMEAGVTSVPVVLQDMDTKYSKQTLDSMTLSSQDFGEDPVNNGATVTVNNLVPIKETNRDELTRLFGGNADVKFSRRSAELNSEYEEAYLDGNDERMQELVDEAARMAGYTYKAYHHTENAFTVFDLNKARKSMDIQGFFFSADPNAEREYGSRRYDTYLKMDNPYVIDSYEKQKAIPFDMSQEDAGVTAREWLQENGYDGVIRKAEYFGGEADEYIVFDSSQIKSSDPVTFQDDENGEGDYIPLSDRFDPNNKDIRYSLRRDSTGRSLSEGQKEYFKDSKAVDKNGNLMVMYHGTGNANFTVFDPQYSDDKRSLFFTNKLSVAEGYSSVSTIFSPAKHYDAGELNELIKDISYGENYIVRQGSTYKLMEVGMIDQEDQVVMESDNIDDIKDRYVDEYIGNMFDIPANYGVYLNLTNPLTIDAKSNNWDELEDIWDKKITTGYNYMTLYNRLGNGEYEIEYSDFDGDGTRVFNTRELTEILTNWEIDQLLNGNEINGIYIDEDGNRVPSNTRQYSEYAQKNGYDGVIFRNIADNGIYGNRNEVSDIAIAFDSNQVKDVNNLNPTDDPDIRYSRISDEALLKRLDNEETITVYRAMQEIDGKLYPPMAARIADETGGKRSLVEPTELGVWYQADERPDLIKNGKFTLDKANGSSLDAAYNPYWHTSRSLLNDQFSSAHKRPNLVTVECEVPVSELTSGYRAEGAKDAVGEMYWHSGPVSSKLAKVGNPRRVILSRYVKVNRIVPDSEAAATIAGMLEGTDIKVPEKVVTPSLREELEKYGLVEADTVRKSRKDGFIFSYDAIVQSDPMKINDVGSIPLKQLVYDKSLKRSDITATARLNIGRYNEIKGTGLGNNKLHNSQIGDTIFTSEGLRHAFRQLQGKDAAERYIMATVNLPLYYEDAMVINETEDLYDMIGIFRDGETAYIVRLAVNKKLNELVDVPSVMAINAKKEDAVAKATKYKTFTSSSEINIVDLLRLVKKHYPDDLPLDILNRFDRERRTGKDNTGLRDLLHSRRSGESMANLLDIAEANARDERVRNEYIEAAANWRTNMTAISDFGKSGFNTNMSALIRDYNKNIDKNTSERIVGEIRSLTREMVRNKDMTYSDIQDKANVIAAKVLWGESDPKKFPTRGLIVSDDTVRAVDDIRNDIMAQILKSTTRGEGKYQALSKEFADYRKKANDRIAEVRRKRDAKLEEIQIKKREAIARKIDSSERTTLLKRMNRLNKMMKTTSEANQEMIKEFIGEFNLVAKSMTDGKAENLADLSDYIDSMMRIDPDFMPTERTIKDVERLGKKNVADLTIEEVAQLNEALLNLENAIRTSKRLIDSEYKQHISELGNEIIDGVRNTKGIANSKIGVFNWFQQAYDKTIATPVIRPETEILRLVGFDRNNPLYKLTFGDEGSLASGQRDMVRYKWQANKRYTDRFVNDKQFADSIMGKKARACEITGRRADGSMVTLKVTPDMLMALYMHTQNRQNFQHFGEWNDESGHTQHGGGITIPDFNLYRQGKIAEAYRVGTRDGNLITMTRTALNAAFNQLTEKEMAFIRSAQAYYSEMSQPEINRVSNLLLGYSIATEENYFRINTDSNYRGTNMDAIKYDGTLENAGWTKERIKGARNAILLIPLTEQFSRDIDAHAKYVGMAIPIRNFNKAFGVNRQTYDEAGDFTGTETSVQSAIIGKWGSNATDYIQKLMSDIQNPRSTSESYATLLGKLRSFYAGSVLALNAGVAIKQAASYPTAAAEIGWLPLIKAFGNTRFHGKLDMDIVNKYSPLMYLRTQGIGYQELADLKNLNKGWLNRALNSKALNWINDMDVMTIKKLWKASEYYVRDNFKDLKVGSEEYYKKVGEVHSRVIERTQPNYTTLQRGEILRSDSDLVRTMLGMFKTQPFQNFSILFEATGELQAACRAYKVSPNAITEDMRKAAVKKMARALSSQLVSSLVFAIMQAAWDWIRGRDDKYKDKEGKITFASAFKQIGINMGSNGFGMIPLGSVLYEVFETTIDTIVKNNGGEAIFNATAYGLDAGAATGIINDITDAINSFTKNISSIDLDSKNTKERHVRGYVDILTKLAQIGGYPAENFVKDGQAIALNVFRVLGTTGSMNKYEAQYYSKRVFTAVSSAKNDYMSILYDAYDNDKDAYNKLYSIYTENDGFATSSKTSKEYIDDKMNSYIKEQTKNQNRDKAGLTESQLNDYQEALNLFDTDNSGTFTQEETYNALMSIALSQKQKETLWNERGWKKSFSEYGSKKK